MRAPAKDTKFDPPPETCCGDGSECVLDCVWPGKVTTDERLPAEYAVIGPSGWTVEELVVAAYNNDPRVSVVRFGQEREPLLWEGDQA